MNWRAKADEVMERLIREHPNGFNSDTFHSMALSIGMPKRTACRLASGAFKRAARLKKISKNGECRLSSRNSSCLPLWVGRVCPQRTSQRDAKGMDATSKGDV